MRVTKVQVKISLEPATFYLIRVYHNCIYNKHGGDLEHGILGYVMGNMELT